jgi:hypothetical protein
MQILLQTNKLVVIFKKKVPKYNLKQVPLKVTVKLTW